MFMLNPSAGYWRQCTAVKVRGPPALLIGIGVGIGIADAVVVVVVVEYRPIVAR
jgi:hypothetical protein